MGFLLSRIFVFLTVSELSRNGGKPCAALPVPPPQLYWNSVLPNTPMPKSLNQLVKPDENALKYSKGADENASFRYLNGADGNPPFKYSKDGPENLIPFSSSKLPEILNKFSVKPESEAADMINNTIQDCELQGARNEAKQCAASLESMIDFATSTLGKNALAIATEVDKKGAGLKQKYTITTPGVKELSQPAMKTHLKGTLYAFKELKVEPGTVPICHFLKVEDVIWVPNQKPT
ncbi:hypothetical protein ACFX2J_019561 [Malus domestica]